MVRALFFVLATFVISCRPPPPPSGPVANFYEVDPGVFRSAQPTTPEAWAYIKSRGVRTIVKLNDDSEGSDAGAEALGLEVVRVSIPPKGDLVGVFERPDPSKLVVAIAALERGEVLVHCTHGQDRTGLVVGLYRVLHDHRKKSEAYREMRAHGFHPELLGLLDTWEDFDGVTIGSLSE